MRQTEPTAVDADRRATSSTDVTDTAWSGFGKGKRWFQRGRGGAETTHRVQGYPRP